MSFHVGQTIWLFKNQNSQPLPLAVHYQTQSSFPTQTHHKHALSVQHMNTLGITFTDDTHHCAVFICNKTRTPNTSCKLIFTIARLDFHFRRDIIFFISRIKVKHDRTICRQIRLRALTEGHYTCLS